jgi:hypothetical protein
MICFECGEMAEYQHHVIPKSKGGKRTVPLCGVCHAKVHGRLALHTADLELHTAELTRDALLKRKEAGMKTGGDVPYGFTNEAGKLHPSVEEQEGISLIHELRNEGHSLRGICRKLKDAGIPRRDGLRTWHHQVVADILKRVQATA